MSALGNAFVPLCAYVAGMRLLERLQAANTTGETAYQGGAPCVW